MQPTDDTFGSADFGDIDFGAMTKPKTSTERTKEISAVLKSFKERATAERDVFKENVDSEFWCCLCFQTRAQKEEFLTRMGWIDMGDKYLDGVEVAKRQKINLENPVPAVRKRNHSKRWLEFRNV